MRMLLIIFLLAASPALALDEDAYLQDYIGLTKLLRSYGVDPAFVGWREIEQMCLPLQSPASNLDYNRCRLDKALTQTAYRDDRRVCDDESMALYPKNSGAGWLVRNRDSEGKSNTTVITHLPGYPSDVRTGRRYAFDRCMADKGWRNSRNWALGQKF